MKVYVDSELPTESCNGCPYCKGVLVDAGRNKLFFCKANKGKMIKNLQKAFNKCIVKNEFQSLADYTKQVRKELIDKLAIFLIATFSKDAEFSVEEILNWFQEVKDQIQGETK